MRAVHAVRPLKKLVVFNRNAARAEALLESLKGELPDTVLLWGLEPDTLRGYQALRARGYEGEVVINPAVLASGTGVSAAQLDDLERQPGNERRPPRLGEARRRPCPAAGLADARRGLPARYRRRGKLLGDALGRLEHARPIRIVSEPANHLRHQLGERDRREVQPGRGLQSRAGVADSAG